MDFFSDSSASSRHSNDPSASKLNSIPGGQYNGNPGDYYSFLQTYAYLKSYKQLPINLVKPLRPMCLIPEIPELDIDIAFGATSDDRLAITDYLRRRSKYEIQGQQALVLLRTLLADHVYHQVSHIFLDQAITDPSEQIRLILHHLRTEQEKYKSVAIVTETNVILHLKPATNWAALQPLMSTLEVQYQKLLNLGEPRPPTQQKTDLVRMMSATAPDFITVRSLLFQDHMAAQTYQQWRQFICSQQINMTAQHLSEVTSNSVAEMATSAKRPRFSNDLPTSTSAIYSQQKTAAYAPPQDFVPNNSDDSRMPTWFVNYTNRQSTPSSLKPRPCFNCRISTCPGVTDSQLCDKPYCRLCAVKQIYDASGAPDWQWPSKAHPRYHLPHDCEHCPPKYRRVPPLSVSGPSPPTHPRPYSYPRSSTKRAIPEYTPPTKSAIHMFLTDSDHANNSETVDMDPMEALLADYSLV